MDRIRNISGSLKIYGSFVIIIRINNKDDGKQSVEIKAVAEWLSSSGKRRKNGACPNGGSINTARRGVFPARKESEKPGRSCRMRKNPVTRAGYGGKGTPPRYKQPPGGLLDHTNLMPLMNTAFAPGHCRKLWKQWLPGRSGTLPGRILLLQRSTGGGGKKR